MNRQGRPTEPVAALSTAPETFTGNRGAAHRGGADLRDRAHRCDWRRPRRAGSAAAAPRRSRAQGDRPARPLRAGSRAPLRAPLAHELRHRLRRLPARLLHHEAQPAAERENGAVAGFRRHSPAPASVDRARRARADRGAFALAVRAHRHAGGRAHAEGRRARRALRHDGDQGGAHRARREALGRAGAGFGAWHQSGDGCAARLSRRVHPGARGRHGRSRGREEAPLDRCRRHHAHQSQHLRAVRARCRGDCRSGARGRRLFLCGRRELQRDRRQGAARRPRRRCDAHQSAQDLLDAAWRWRAGRGSGDAVGGARTVRAASVTSSPMRMARGSSNMLRMARESRSAACARSTARWACSCAP